jgi:hypothetical protein
MHDWLPDFLYDSHREWSIATVLRISVNPRTEVVKILRTCIFGNRSKSSDSEFLVEWHSYLSSVCFIRRVRVVQLSVITSRSTPLESTSVD